MAEGGISGLFSRFTGSGRGNTQGALDGTNIDKRTIEKVQRFLEKLVKLCSNPQLGLKRSPPYLLDLLPHMFQTLSEIFKQYDSRMSDLNSNQYFRLFIDNICNKLKRGIKLFRDTRNVYNENSTERKTLTRLSLHISHMLYELRALFPNSIFIGADFRITKEEAADFWKSSFGDKVIVSWKDFRMALSAVHPITSSYEAMALKSTIDLTHNDMVSVFEFDVFTRLFQPWDTLLINWKMLAVTHTGYQAFLTYGEVKERLLKYTHKPGTYIFRLSCTRLGQWAIGYVTNEHEILQTIPQNKSLCEALILGAQEGYYLYPDGKEQNPDLTVIQHEKQKKVIQVTEEEYEIYTSMGSTFQQCKICQENDKDVKLQPCAHLLCSECLFQWQEHDKSSSLTCPFCRAQVKDYEHVEVDPFHGSVTTIQKSRKENKLSRTEGDGAGPSRAAPPVPGAPPIPDRRTSVKQQSSISPSRGQAPAPPSIPRRPGEGDSLVPTRPPPLPPVNTMPVPKPPGPFQPPTVTSQPPPLPSNNVLHMSPVPPPILSAPPGTTQPPPSLPLTQPPPLHNTPGNDSFSSSMSATNPFFSDVQALRSQDPPGFTDAAEKRMTNYANVEYHGHRMAEYTDNIITVPSDKRTTIFAEIQSEETYDNIGHEDHMNGGTHRGPLADSDLFAVAPSPWDVGHFDETLPKITENNDLYCNVDSQPPPPPPPSDDVTKQTLTSPMPGGKSASPLLNIALRPTSLYDPDQSLFDREDHPPTGDDIYENQTGNVSSNMSSPATPLTTKEKLLAEGFRETDVQRAVDIVGENEEMARKILLSFVARN
ncbi:hypothetical protein ACHWQZ_G001917 [Mnemiopsis leidyi]